MGRSTKTAAPPTLTHRLSFSFSFFFFFFFLLLLLLLLLLFFFLFLLLLLFFPHHFNQVPTDIFFRVSVLTTDTYIHVYLFILNKYIWIYERQCECVRACVCLRVLLLSFDYSIRRDLPVVFSSGGNF